MDNKEYELKLKITEKEAELIKNEMQFTGQVKLYRQKDVYFCPENEDIFQYMNKKCIRIRNTNGIVSLDYKELFDESNVYMQKMEEYSTQIFDEDQLERILEKIGLYKAVTVSKERIECIYKEQYLLFLDYVEKLGYFLEIELLNVNGNDTILSEQIRNVVKELGIHQIVINKSGYSNMLLQKIYGEDYGF